MSLSPFSGEQIVQVANPDPFAKPVLRAPVLHTPIWMIATAQAFRLLWRLIRFIARHPVLDVLVALLVMAWRWLGWLGPVIVLAVITMAAATWWLRWRDTWNRLVILRAGALGCPALSGQRIWSYFMPHAAGSGTRCGLPAESCSRVLNGDESDYTGAQCSAQCPLALS